MSAVTDLLDKLVAGSMTLDQVAEEFRTYAWPRYAPAPPAGSDEAWARLLEDPETPPEGSFFDVSTYFDQRKITGEQYDVLAEAAAEGMKGSGEDEGADEAATSTPEPPAGGVDPEDDETHVLTD